MSADSIKLEVAKREITGKKVAKLRHDGQIPAVVYGAEIEPVNIQAPLGVIEKVVSAAGTHTPVEIDVDGKSLTAIIKSVDIDPVTNTIEHLSFQAVSRDQIVTTEVPVVVIGEDESDAKKAGLVILQSIEQLEVKAKPADLPKNLEISAAGLAEHGDRLTVADIKLPAGVEFTDEDMAQTVATVYEPAALAAANEAADTKADEAAAEPTEGEAAAEGETSAEGAADGDKPAEEAKSE